jgi:hypothetical protein
MLKLVQYFFLEMEWSNEEECMLFCNFNPYR